MEKKSRKKVNTLFTDEQLEKLEEPIEVEKEDVVPTEPVIIDDETSDTLKAIKEKEIANIPKVETTEEFDIKNFEEETIIKDDIERFIDVDINVGLNDEQVAKRIEQGYVNKNTNNKGKSYLGIVLSNIFTFFNILYFVIAIILIILEDYSNLFFLVVVFANLFIGIFQEVRAKMTVDKMRIMSAPSAIVIRNGEKIKIATEEVVLDDILYLQAGKQICADCIILDGSIEVNEALLTGEADAIHKGVGGKLFSGSFLSSGTCIARADTVGKDCFIEKMSSDAKKYTPPKSELLRTLKSVIRIITILIFPIAILYILAHSQSTEWIKIFQSIKQVSYIILAMIPAGLFLLTSVALFVGVHRLGKNNTLVQELYCIEMLARVNVLCLDKTGTITDGTMRVCDCVEINNTTDYTIREIVGSMMNAFKETNPTSDALIKYFDKNSVLSPTEIIPFSSKRKYSAVTFGTEGTFILGAPDFVVKEHYEKISAKVDRFAHQGCRVLVLGYTTNKIKGEDLPRYIKPLALIVLQDHIRDDAADTISFFKQNDVDIKVISGDNPETVSIIANRVGIEGADNYINLNNMTDEEIKEKVFDYTIFGRVSPSQKKLIVQTLKKAGKVVAMTGDGVNDIPALKEADCSIAMASGSEATRYVSHLVLMDSNFSSMPKVVKEGRRVINNIQKTSSLYLTKNLFAALIAIMYIIIGFTTKGLVNAFNTNFPFEAKNLMMIEYIILGFATTILAIQPNNEPINGKFITNVLREILPGTLTVVVFQLFLYFAQGIEFKDGLLFDELCIKEVYFTISSIVTTAVMFFVLIDTCKPMNTMRKLLISVVFIFIMIFVFVPWFSNKAGLDYSKFSGTEWLLLIVLLQAAHPIMSFIKMLLVTLHIIPAAKKK